MAKNAAPRTSKLSLEQTYLSLTEHLVRDYDLSLNFLENPEKPRSPRQQTATYQPSDLLTPAQAAAVLGLV
ncbi:hypothetical protein [Mesorhizobium sp. A623]